VVDDETIVADTLADILNRNGYHAIAAYGSTEALQRARESCPDIVLCDVLMPELNGVETAKALQRACPAARIILFSGQAASSALLERARAQGHHFEVLAKPIHPRQLLRKLSPIQ
jgi:CheY-like chemotaxis protein